MKQGTKYKQSYVIPIVIVILIGVFTALGSIWGNLATSNPPEFIKPLLPYSWYIFGIIVSLSIAAATWQLLYQTNTNTPVPAASSNSQQTSQPTSATSQSVSSSPYASCFICYSHHDQAFADKLYGDLQAKGVKCWYAAALYRTNQRETESTGTWRDNHKRDRPRAARGCYRRSQQAGNFMLAG